MAAWGLGLNRNPKSFSKVVAPVYLPPRTVGTGILNTWHHAVLSIMTVPKGGQR